MRLTSKQFLRYATARANREPFPLSGLHILLFAFIIMILISAFAVVYVKDLNRRLFIEYQELQQTHQQIEIDWGKLLLERSTWSTQSRIQRIASEQLQMIAPKPREIVMIEQVSPGSINAQD